MQLKNNTVVLYDTVNIIYSTILRKGRSIIKKECCPIRCPKMPYVINKSDFLEEGNKVPADSIFPTK